MNRSVEEREKIFQSVKKHTTHSMNESVTGVRREARRGRRNRYEYFQRLTFVRLVTGISGNIGWGERKRYGSATNNPND
jgi:hypothetical protein